MLSDLSLSQAVQAAASIRSFKASASIRNSAMVGGNLHFRHSSRRACCPVWKSISGRQEAHSSTVGLSFGRPPRNISAFGQARIIPPKISDISFFVIIPPRHTWRGEPGGPGRRRLRRSALWRILSAPSPSGFCGICGPPGSSLSTCSCSRWIGRIHPRM